MAENDSPSNKEVAPLGYTEAKLNGKLLYCSTQSAVTNRHSLIGLSAAELSLRASGDYFRLPLLPSLDGQREQSGTNLSAAVEEIIRSLRPTTVLVVACSPGLLVESFWDHGIEAHAIDPSESAISGVRADIKRFCSVGSLLDPIATRFDLLTCLEVLAHLQPEYERVALQNFCSATDAILFSATPLHTSSTNAINTRPPLYWLKLFSEIGFLPDLRYDASFLSADAILLRKTSVQQPQDILALFADVIHQRTKLAEANDRSSLAVARSNALAQECSTLFERSRLAQAERAEAEERYESLSSELMAEIAGLKGNLGALEQQHNETSWRLELASKELNEIVASPGWGVIQRYRGWVARQRQVRPRLFARYEKLALSMLWRLGGKRGFDRAGVHEVVGPVSAEENLKRDTKSRSIEVDISKFVLILSGGPDVSYRYRAEHQAEEFGLLGLTADAALFNTVDYGRVWQQYRAFILHRVPYTPEIEDFIKRAKAAGKPVIFDTDDLVFNEALIGEIKAIRDFSPEEFSLHLEGIKRYYRTLSLCQAALVTTEELRDRIKELFHEMPVYVNRNAVSDEMVGRADAAIKHISKVDDGAVRAIYMSGTRTHNEDFVQCVGALARLMQSYPQLRLMIAGLLDLPEVLRNWIDRIEFIPLLPFEELPRLMRRADINLAPLELNNAFTHCKSELKYFEAGLLGLPTVASRVPVFQNAITPGENGFLCKSEQDWFEAIERLICSPELRRRIGSRAREDVLERFTTRSRAPELTQTLRRIFDDLGLAGPRRLSVAIVTQAPIAQTGGGYKNIFRIGNWLADHGHDVHIYVEAVAHLAGLTDAEIVAFCHCYFGSSAAQIHVGHDQILASDVALATAFPTAFTVNNLTNTRCKAYLIQDFEPEFFETSDPSYDSAERTYDLPLKKIALGKYLQNLFSKRDRVPVEQIPFALDSSNFRNLALRPQSPIRVLFFARPGMKRRAYPVGVAALRILARTHPEVEIAFYGMREPEELGFRYQNLGELSPEQLSREMNRSHIHLSFSLTNISWVPLEAMASGCAVLEAKVPSVTMWTETEADAEVPCLLAEPNPPAVADALINLVNDHHLRQRLSEHGQRFAAAVCTSWDKTCQQIEKIFLRTVLQDEYGYLSEQSNAPRSSISATSGP
jgi:glycosyltransferase involved in cell wall biosynthesis